MLSRQRGIRIIVLGLSALFAPCDATRLAAADWTGWRGHDRTARVEFQAPAAWPKTVTRVWQVEIGEGHATPVVKGDFIYSFARVQDEESVSQHKLGTGELLWNKKYAAPCKVDSAADWHGLGPKSSPLLHNGTLVTQGISGVLSAWSPQDGKRLWQRTFVGEFAKTWPLFGTAASPLGLGQAVVANVGGHDSGALAAFDLASGKTVWQWTEDGPSYASPNVELFAGKPVLLTQTQRFAAAFDPNSGKLLWKKPYATEYVQNVVCPLVYQELILLSGYNMGLSAVRISNGEPDEVWHTREQSLYMSAPVLVGDRLIGFSQREKGRFFALDPRTGKTLWQSPGRQGENASLLVAGDVIIALTDRGELRFFAAGGTRYQELARYEVSSTPTWAHPVFVGDDRFLIKNDRTLALWKLGE